MEILCYTRDSLEDILYANKLAYSMHLALKRGQEMDFVPLHHNEGLLYAKAVQREDGTLVAKSLCSPWVFQKKEGGYGVVAVRIEGDGQPDTDSEGCMLLWESMDLVHYREIGLVRLQEKGYISKVCCEYSQTDGTYKICWEDRDGRLKQAVGDPFAGCMEKACEPELGTIVPWADSQVIEASGGIEGCHPGNILTIPDEVGNYLWKKLTVPFCERVVLLENEGSAEAGDTVQPRALAYYSDGTVVERGIDWNPDSGMGRVHQEHFPFPFAENRADPCCMYWHGKYYFIATNDADGNHTLYIRCADTLEGILTAEEVLLLDSVTYSGIGGLLWAPEFHEIDGRLYIFHAATKGEFFWEESRVMQLREGGNPMCREDWSEPRLVVRKDGTPLCEAGRVISLDMTTFEYEGRVYAMWSQRQFLPVDQGAWLYLAEIDRKEPWRLLSDPVCVALPEYGWENNHTFVVEGPYAIWNREQLMVTYSGAAVDATYAVGLLKPVMGSNILEPSNWIKNNYPLLTSRSVPGEFGPGHNSYMTDENGLTWNFYHAKPGVDGPRSSCARRVHFDVDGEPMLDVTEEADLPQENMYGF